MGSTASALEIAAGLSLSTANDQNHNPGLCGIDLKSLKDKM